MVGNLLMFIPAPAPNLKDWVHFSLLHRTPLLWLQYLKTVVSIKYQKLEFEIANKNITESDETTKTCHTIFL